jgi:uncharacterized protein YndB with AHSA1/START domain
MKHNMTDRHIVGKTKDTGFQIGVRKTFPISLEQAWRLITSREGIKLWLGDVEDFHLAKGQLYQTKDGTLGEVRVVNPRENIRLTWQPQEWQRASTIQVRVIPSREKTIVSFHQEGLSGEVEREQMRQRWDNVLDELQALLQRPTK